MERRFPRFEKMLCISSEELSYCEAMRTYKQKAATIVAAKHHKYKLFAEFDIRLERFDFDIELVCQIVGGLFV